MFYRVKRSFAAHLVSGSDLSFGVLDGRTRYQWPRAEAVSCRLGLWIAD